MYRCLFIVSTLWFLLSAIVNANAVGRPHIVIDVESGTILSEHLPDHRWYPASLTKLMTAYVTFQAIKAGEIELGSPVEVSAAATRQPPSKMGYKKGTNLRIDTALKIIIIKSANDVSQALAEAVAGDLKNFVERMNYEAARLGLNNTRFANANGLHNTNQFSSARDMALLSRHIIQEFPQYAYLFSSVAIKTPKQTHYSYNLLLERFPGTTGMKTGFVCASGFNLVASAKSSGRHLIAVVLGRDSQTDRATTAAKLLEENFLNVDGPSVLSPRSVGAAPKNMRPVLCTEAARAARYNPTPSTAIIKSAHLNPRQVSDKILTVNTGGIDGKPSDAWIFQKFAAKRNVPVPSKRPNYDPIAGKIVLAAIGLRETGQIAIPTPRPR